MGYANEGNHLKWEGGKLLVGHGKKYIIGHGNEVNHRMWE